MSERKRLLVYFNSERDIELLEWIKRRAEAAGRSQSGQALFMLRQAQKVEKAAARARRKAISEIDWESV